ncbi:putative uncharacterized protein [Parachlamydia acanthamoebae UV-7]|uniref:Uncharacterized protein n=2 Tax=Parachlamydia acanthamoebae TaxID=83552 RepID=F8KV54_PARAV|nr:hypothetical protein [Parachlamydia acanthamoebae]CCB85134.1 putative uncharacterized protein [Parachlamydia acanthamoebae UV-7]
MNISVELKLELERRARQTKDKHEHTRLCVVLARSEGMSHELIAQAHRISVQAFIVISQNTKQKRKHNMMPEVGVKEN